MAPCGICELKHKGSFCIMDDIPRMVARILKTEVFKNDTRKRSWSFTNCGKASRPRFKASYPSLTGIYGLEDSPLCCLDNLPEVFGTTCKAIPVSEPCIVPVSVDKPVIEAPSVEEEPDVSPSMTKPSEDVIKKHLELCDEVLGNKRRQDLKDSMFDYKWFL